MCGFGRSACFNTQPPEGGWIAKIKIAQKELGFNTQPPEGGWLSARKDDYVSEVSTHSRPKAAGLQIPHEQIPEGVSTHSRPKAAGAYRMGAFPQLVSFNTQPPEGGWSPKSQHAYMQLKFQHTAARRRLVR